MLLKCKTSPEEESRLWILQMSFTGPRTKLLCRGVMKGTAAHRKPPQRSRHRGAAAEYTSLGAKERVLAKVLAVQCYQKGN